ncbi:helix-turn-helix transcriptional regulator, partial [Salmonella enterica subsp. enterica]|nr:helix-turn-helix transcriptional regulator [Salmonella enterica subsp. enterica]
MSRNYAEKLRQIRKAEGLTQKDFSELTGVALGTIKKYETGHQPARAEVLESVIEVQMFEKYTLWLMTDKTA